MFTCLQGFLWPKMWGLEPVRQLFTRLRRRIVLVREDAHRAGPHRLVFAVPAQRALPILRARVNLDRLAAHAAEVGDVFPNDFPAREAFQTRISDPLFGFRR